MDKRHFAQYLLGNILNYGKKNKTRGINRNEIQDEVG